MKRKSSPFRILPVKRNTLEGILLSEGYCLSKIQASKDPIPESANEFSAIIILGGPMSVYEGIKYLDEEQAIIQDAVQNKIPTLGICLGSQLDRWSYRRNSL